MGVLICLRESGLVGMGAMFGGDVIQSRFIAFDLSGRVGERGMGLRVAALSRDSSLLDFAY